MKNPFPPSAKKLRDARNEGKLLKSPMLTSACAFAAAAAVTRALRTDLSPFTLFVERCFLGSPGDPAALFREAVVRSVGLALPPLAAGAVIGVLCEAMSTGFLMNPSLISPKGERLDPVGGLKRIASSLKEIPVISIRFAAAVAVGVYLLLRVTSISAAVRLAPPEAGSLLLLTAFDAAAVAGAVTLLASGTVEYLLRRRRYFDDLSMTFDEVKREHREQEGDPHLKAHRLSLQQIGRAHV